MKLESGGAGTIVLRLDVREAALLRHALERALLIDTPPQEQESIASFASRLLDTLAGRA
jgi:hypothetical protein